VDLFDPAVEPLDFVQAFGRSDVQPGDFKFLSVFKWETRKGWDILLKAYFLEFTRQDNVILILKTNAYHADRPFSEDIEKFVRGRISPLLSPHLPGGTHFITSLRNRGNEAGGRGYGNPPQADAGGWLPGRG